jgi:hypothetical protein
MIETQRLRLRRITLSDADAAFMLRLVNDPGWLANIGDRNVRDLEQSKTELQDKILDLEKFEEVVVGRELKMIALEKELENLQAEVQTLKADGA